LNFRPSQIAACAVLLAINIFEEDSAKVSKSKKFFKQSKGPLRELNVSIWNNEEITSITGYAFSDLQNCLYDLSQFIALNLSPNRLAGFDIEAIKSVEAFNQIPSNIGLDLKNL